MKLLFSPAFCQSLFVWAFSLVTNNTQGQNVRTDNVKISVNPAITIATISPDFIGLGYETSAVAQSNYFDGKNATLIQLYRNLSPNGIIRIGGNISDHTKYVADSVSIPHTEKEVTIINHEDLVNLENFSSETGWKVIWGLNLGTGTKEEAAQEAVAVSEALGDDLHSFQIGNEVDLQGNYDRKYDNFQSYFSDFLAYKAAIRSTLPRAVFSGPDVAGNISWLKLFANNEANDLKLLTYHYYRTGAHSANATIETLLKTDSGWNRKLKELQEISQKNNVPFRINEVNSFYGGGKPGVSNTFASALWCLDYMFELASYGCNGVNMETDINQLGWISDYSPIVHDQEGNVSVRPEYYGMLAFSLAGEGALIKLNLAKKDINLSAYATMKDNGKYIWITVINKDIFKDALLDVAAPDGYSHVAAFSLKAPEVTSETGVTLAGAEVSKDGKWTAGSPEYVRVKNATVHLKLPHASAVLLRLSRK